MEAVGRSNHDKHKCMTSPIDSKNKYHVCVKTEFSLLLPQSGRGVSCPATSPSCGQDPLPDLYMIYGWYLLTVNRKRNQNLFAWQNTQKLTTHLILASMCFLFFQTNFILVPFPAHHQQVLS